MSAGCHSCAPTHQIVSKKQRLVLWTALVLNAAMFLVEIFASRSADSVSLKADAIDFLGDAANYAISLFVIGMSLHTRAKASLFKALTMGLFGAWVIGQTIYNVIYISNPVPETMGTVGLIAMLVNLFVALILFQFKDGDSNMRSVWLCTRNDVIGNIAVIIAASGVFYTTTRWPDLIVAFGMGAMALQSSYEVTVSARSELKTS